MGYVNNRQLIVGIGEVGTALKEVLKDTMTIDRHKGGSWDGYAVEVAHICFPYSKEFKKEVKKWKELSDLVIVHSTTPVGVCDALGVVHSPITGVHPHLEEGIRTFVKYFGGKDAKKAAKIFSNLGIETKIYKDARTTEAMKLWSTTQYGRMIMLEKEIHAWCAKNDVDFKAVYTTSNLDYNIGYTKLGMSHVVRPILRHKEGPIGGHCVQNNAKLLRVKL